MLNRSILPINVNKGEKVESTMLSIKNETRRIHLQIQLKKIKFNQTLFEDMTGLKMRRSMLWANLLVGMIFCLRIINEIYDIRISMKIVIIFLITK